MNAASQPAATTFLLVRHALHDLVGKALAGRKPGVSLNAEGFRQANELARRLAGESIDAIIASPRERAQQTAAPLAERLGINVRINAAIDDIDFGEWTGRTFVELTTDWQWPIWVNQRSAAQPPGGETIAEVQQRVVRELQALATAHEGQRIALFSHCDVIKSALAHFLAISLDRLETFEIAPASISVIVLGRDWAHVRRVNDTGSKLY